MKQIPGTNQRYFASADGEIYSSASYKSRKCETRKKKLKQCLNRNGDLVVGIAQADKPNGKTELVANLICLAFNGEPPGRGYKVYYIDSDKTNVRSDNLIWMSKSSSDIRKLMSLTNEQVRAVPGYPGYYAIAATGDVISVKNRKAYRLKVTLTETGYHRLSLSGTALYVHRIVAMAFLPDPKPGHDQVRHLNGDKTDNRPSNLKWGTHFENNFYDKQEHGSLKLSFEAAREIRLAITRGVSQTELGRAYNVSRSMIGAIRCNKTWRERECGAVV